MSLPYTIIGMLGIRKFLITWRGSHEQTIVEEDNLAQYPLIELNRIWMEERPSIIL